MNKKMLLIFLSLFIILGNAKAQLEKPKIGVMPFAYSDKRFARNSRELQGIVNDILARKKHMHLLDILKTKQIQKELNSQKGMGFLNGKTISQCKAVGADIILVGDLTNMEVIKVKANMGKMMHGIKSKVGKDIDVDDASSNKLIITFSLQAFNAETGELLDNKRFQLSAMDANNVSLGGFFETQSTSLENSVITRASRVIEKEVEEWVDLIVPPSLKIVTVDKKDKKGYPYLVSIIGGKDADLHIGSRLVLYELTNVNIGDKILIRKNDIAELKVIELQGDLSQCKVTSGASEVNDKWQNKNTNLLVDHSSRFPTPHKR